MKKNTVKKIKGQFRQGDVLIERVESIPADAKPIKREDGRVILAHGESTGHAHAIAAPGVKHRKVDGKKVTYLEVTGRDVQVQHEEHGHIPMEAKRESQVIRQQEYTPEAPRNVAD